MSTAQLFLSYNRSNATTAAADRLFRRARVQLGRRAEVFFDQRSIPAGTEWQPAIDAALARCTHFVALVSVDYWLSDACQHELTTAVTRYQAGGSPRLLFVLAEPLDPNALELDTAVPGATQGQQLYSQVRSLGQINFLGPHDAAGRLVPLALDQPAALDAQLAALVGRVGALVPAA